VPADKSLFHYGSLYHRVLDPLLAETRRVAVDLVPEGSSVLDIACGTGQLCFDLREKKHCQVVGVDLSLRMLDFARGASRWPDVHFLHLDAVDLAGIADQAFDVSTVVLLVHELPSEKRVCVLREALRVARAALIIDAAAPLPWTAEGLSIRLAEYTVGREHSAHLRDFLARGGIMGLLAGSGDSASVVRQLLFMQKAREAVMVQPSR
jgi:ubiquinone/menaquinone biosynthesis C-methylase UbiE